MRAGAFTCKLVTLAIISLLAVPSVSAQSHLDMAIQTAKNFENSGRYSVAARSYQQIAEEYGTRSAYGEPVTKDLARLLLRRSLACKIVEMRSGKRPVEARDLLEHLWTLQSLEPDNPAWPYLRAMVRIKGSDDFDVFPDFHRAMQCKGGDASEHEKIAADYRKYAPLINKRIDQAKARVMQQDIEFDREGGAAGFMRRMTPSASSSSSSSSHKSSSGGQKDPWGVHSAENAGDYAAADRLRGGNGTGQDVGKYMH